MNIRVAREADIPHMHTIRLSVRENQLSNSSRVQPGHYNLMMQHGRGWVAEVDGRIVGFAVADLTKGTIWALFVDPAFEGRGIGRRLHDVMVEWLFDSDADELWLNTDAATRAESFYRTAGWRLAGYEANGELRFQMTRADWPLQKPG